MKDKKKQMKCHPSVKTVFSQTAFNRLKATTLISDNELPPEYNMHPYNLIIMPTDFLLSNFPLTLFYLNIGLKVQDQYF